MGKGDEDSGRGVTGPASCSHERVTPELRAGFLVFHIRAVDTTWCDFHQILISSMDIDGPSSSPPLRHTSLPPSSGPQPGRATSSRNGTPTRPRPAADALAFGDEDGDDGTQDTAEPRRRARMRQSQMNADVPVVKDAVGESVRESFEVFLKTYVCSFSPRLDSPSRFCVPTEQVY